MIEISLSVARHVVAVLKQSVWALRPRRIPPVRFEASRSGLQISSAYDGVVLWQPPGLVVHHVQRGRHHPEVLTLPGTALRDFAGTDKSAVRLEQISETHCLATWEENRRVRRQEYPLAEEVPAPPTPPETFVSLPTDRLTAIHDAMETAGEATGRYNLAAILLYDSGVVVGTDGRQLLWQEDFPWRWPRELVPDTGVFGCPILRRKEALIGRTETHLQVRMGEWAVDLPFLVEARYPRVETVLDSLPDHASRWNVAPDEVDFLLRHLPQLPVESETALPGVTIDLQSTACIRARKESTSRGVELVLGHSQVEGPPVRLTTDPRYLIRALRLGFRTFEIAAEKPVRCREGKRIYVWMPLASAPLESGDDERIFSDTDHPQRRK